MCTVEDANLALLVWLVVVGNQNRQTSFCKRDFVMNGLRALDDPEAKDFAGVQNLIDIAVFFVNLVSFCTRITGYDAVYQRRAEGVFLFNPCDEIVAQIPLTSVAQNSLFQFLADIDIQLAGEDD